MLYSLKLLIMSINKTEINKPPRCSQIHICFGLEEKESWNDWFGNPVRSKLSAVITIYRCATGLPLTSQKINGIVSTTQPVSGFKTNFITDLSRAQIDLQTSNAVLNTKFSSKHSHTDRPTGRHASKEETMARLRLTG